MQYILPFVIAMVTTMTLMTSFMKLAVRWQIIDRPSARKVHSQPIARIGGLAMAAGLLMAALLSVDVGRPESAFLLAAGVLLVFGVLDDRYDLDYRLKFLGQLLAVVIVIGWGGVSIDSVMLTERVQLPQWCALPLTVIFLLGITNAINLADGLDGLAGGTTFLCLGALGLVARSDALSGPTGLALASAGAVLGFLRFNTFPARVFMGDAGSQLLGFTVGVLGILITQNSAVRPSPAVPVLLAGLPILDTLSVMAQRLSEGRALFSADRNHLHHKLLALGFDHREAVTAIYAVQIALFVLAYQFRFASDLLILAAFLALSLGVIVLLHGAARSGWRWRESGAGNSTGGLSRLVATLSRPDMFPLWSARMIAGGLCAYTLLVTIQVQELQADFALLLSGLLVASLASLALRRSRALTLVDKAVLYVLAVLLVYLDTTQVAGHRWASGLNWGLPLGLALVSALRLRMSPDRRFELTPLDLIVVFIALVVPNLPGLIDLPTGAPLGIAKIVVLFYSIELLLGSGEVAARGVRLVAIGSLVLLSSRPLWPAI